MEKTVTEWLEGLPEPQKEQALANLRDDNADIQEPCLSEALLSAFLWDTSPQGHEYWEEIATKAEGGCDE